MEQPDSARTRQFTLFPQLPLELRLCICEFALSQSRIVTIESDWSEAYQRTFLRFGKSDNPPMLLQVNRESRSFTLRTYHLSFDSEYLFNCPKYFNNAKDNLHMMGDWIYCKNKPWLGNTSTFMEGFKKIRHLKMLNGMAYYYLWTPFPKPGMTKGLLYGFPALESFSIQKSKRFNSSSEDVNRNTINAQSQMLLQEISDNISLHLLPMQLVNIATLLKRYLPLPHPLLRYPRNCG